MTLDGFCIYDGVSNAVCEGGTWWCGYVNLVAMTVVWLMIWCALFYASAWGLFPRLQIAAKWPSKYPNEETPYWFANHLVSTIHSALISCMAVPTFLILLRAPVEAQLLRPSLQVGWMNQEAMAANTAHIFLSYILFDFIVGFVHSLHDATNAIHHVIFFSFTVLVMWNCFFAFPAVTLLLMEVSTVCLNVFSFWRNRLGYSHIIVKISMSLFGCTFLLFRVIAMGYLLVRLTDIILVKKQVEFVGTPAWNIVCIFLGFSAAFFLQLFWSVAILKKSLKVVSGEGDKPYQNLDSK